MVAVSLKKKKKKKKKKKNIIFFFFKQKTAYEMCDSDWSSDVCSSDLVIDFAAVPFLDSTAANTILGLAQKARRRGVGVVLTGTTREQRRELFQHGVRPPLVSYAARLESALPRLRRRMAARG